MKTFEELQAGLGPVWRLNRPAVGVDHVVVVLPSYSVGEALLSHYATRIPALEQRYLVTSLMLHRIEACELAFLTCQTPGLRVLDYSLRWCKGAVEPAAGPGSGWWSCRTTLPGPSPRSSWIDPT